MKDAERRLLEMLFRETPEVITELLDELGNWLQKHRPEYYSKLQHGVNAERLDEFEGEFAIKLPVSFRMLYQWRNGQHPDCVERFQDNRMMMPLEEIANTKHMLDSMSGSDFEDPNWWRKEWVPFLANGAGDHLCLDLSSADGELPPKVIAFWHDWENRSIEHPSIKVWLNHLVTSMQDGTYVAN